MGELAVGKLVKGADLMKPQVEAFVDDEAGADVAQKVQRRLQHFIDRKIAALFEPACNERDEVDRFAAWFCVPIGRGAGHHPA